MAVTPATHSNMLLNLGDPESATEIAAALSAIWQSLVLPTAWGADWANISDEQLAALLLAALRERRLAQP